MSECVQGMGIAKKKPHNTVSRWTKEPRHHSFLNVAQTIREWAINSRKCWNEGAEVEAIGEGSGYNTLRHTAHWLCTRPALHSARMSSLHPTVRLSVSDQLVLSRALHRAAGSRTHTLKHDITLVQLRDSTWFRRLTSQNGPSFFTTIYVKP